MDTNMDGDVLTFHGQLRKIPSSPPPTEKTLGEALCLLWDTRKIGLSSLQKSTVQSLLGIQSSQDLDPVLACLRSIIRNSLNFDLVVSNINSDGVGDNDGIGASSIVQKLFPPDISVHLQTTLTLLLKKHHSLWKEEDLAKRTTCIPAASSQSMDFPQEDNLVGISTNQIVPSTTDTLSNDDNMRVIPHLKSMTWNMERVSSILTTNRIAIITVKLEDHGGSSETTEIKFRISKDTLEAMLRSLTHISDLLSKSAEPTSPIAKKQKH